MTMKSTTRYVTALLMSAGICGTASARNPWLTATTANGKTKPFSVRLGESARGQAETATRTGLTSEMSGGTCAFDIVIVYYGNPDGDYDGDTQDPINPSTQDKIENIIGYMADAVCEMTEGAHRLKKS